MINARTKARKSLAVFLSLTLFLTYPVPVMADDETAASAHTADAAT